MPLYKTISFNSSTQILIWKITESYSELLNEVLLNEKSILRLNNMKSQLHQRAFLSVRKLLQEVGYSDFDLYYDEFGKPHLKNNKHISITHSHNFSAIILSNETVGIDIELQRDKIALIANKFINDAELNRLKNNNNIDYIKKLTVKWGAKESIFKILNEAGISFKNHIRVDSFEIMDKKAIASFESKNTTQKFSIYFEEIDSNDNEQEKQNFILVYAFKKISSKSFTLID